MALGQAGPNQTWVAMFAYGVPVPPWPFSLGANTVDVFLDPNNYVSVVDYTNTFGFLGVRFDLTGLPVSSQIAFQAVFSNWDNSNCVAASNALVLTVQQP